MVRERNWKTLFVDAFIYLVLGLLLLTCVLPFMHEVALSLSSRAAVTANQVTLWPVGYNLDNYAAVVGKERFTQSLLITMLRLFVAVPATLLVSAMAAYPLSLERIHLPGRKAFMLLMIFSGLFQVGLIPRYLSYKSLGLIDNFLVYVAPLMLMTYNVVLMVSFFKGIPYELVESAMLDGANHWDILRRIMLPLSYPVMAAISLFTIVYHWNSWFDGVVFIRNTALWPLQTYLYSILTTQEVAAEFSSARFSGLLPNVSPHGAEAALIIFSILPLLVMYPILQRYFISGMTIGAVKE